MHPRHLETTPRYIEIGLPAAFAANWYFDELNKVNAQISEIDALELRGVPEIIKLIVLEKKASLEQEREREENRFKMSIQLAGLYLGREVEGSDTFFAQS